jgi:hydroxyacylglutathione hydrolase
MSFQIETFPVYPLGCNCSILYLENQKEAIVIDPGGEGDKIYDKLQKKGYEISYILHTHAHFDHCLSSETLRDRAIGSTLCMHKGDLPLFQNLKIQCQAFGVPFHEAFTYKVDKFLEDEEVISSKIQNFGVKVIHTPGHTPGSICFLVSDSEKQILFSGDTLFSGSIGRTDLWGGDSDLIIKSIETRIFTLESETIVVPGHGEFTNVQREKKTNPFF